MERETKTVSIGGVEFRYRRFTMRQLLEVGPAVDELIKMGKDYIADQTAFDIDKLTDVRLKILSVAFTRFDKTATPDFLLDLETNPNEMRAAVDAVLNESGLFQKKEGASGEAEAPAASQTLSEAATGLSPQAADTPQP